MHASLPPFITCPKRHNSTSHDRLSTPLASSSLIRSQGRKQKSQRQITMPNYNGRERACLSPDTSKSKPRPPPLIDSRTPSRASTSPTVPRSGVRAVAESRQTRTWSWSVPPSHRVRTRVIPVMDVPRNIGMALLHTVRILRRLGRDVMGWDGCCACIPIARPPDGAS